MYDVFSALHGTSGFTISGKAAKIDVGRAFDKDISTTVLY